MKKSGALAAITQDIYDALERYHFPCEVIPPEEIQKMVDGRDFLEFIVRFHCDKDDIATKWDDMIAELDDYDFGEPDCDFTIESAFPSIHVDVKIRKGKII